MESIKFTLMGLDNKRSIRTVEFSSTDIERLKGEVDAYAQNLLKSTLWAYSVLIEFSMRHSLSKAIFRDQDEWDQIRKNLTSTSNPQEQVIKIYRGMYPSNTVVGYLAGSNVYRGMYPSNTVIGYLAGSNVYRGMYPSNTVVGYLAGSNVYRGMYPSNTVIGCLSSNSMEGAAALLLLLD